MLPTIKSHPKDFDFIMHILYRLVWSAQHDNLRNDIVSNVVHDVLFCIASDFKIQQMPDESSVVPVAG